MDNLCSAQQYATAGVPNTPSANAQYSASGVVSDSTDLGKHFAGSSIIQTQMVPDAISSDATVEKTDCSSTGLQKKMSDNTEPSKEGTCSKHVMLPVDLFYKLQGSDLFGFPYVKDLLDDSKSVVTVQVKNPSPELIAKAQDDLQRFMSSAIWLAGSGRRGDVPALAKRFQAQRETVPPSQPEATLEALGVEVHVCNGDLTKICVDAVVNPANRELKNGGGAAFAIAEASGEEFHEFCRSYIREHGQLPTGKVAACKASGSLQQLGVKYVINCVGPAYYEFHDESGAVLTKTVLNCLRKAEDLGCTGVAMPAISAGIFGVPLNDCTKAYVDGVFHFISSELPQCVRHIYFVELDKYTCDAIRDEFALRLPSFLETAAIRNFEARSQTSSAPHCDDERKKWWATPAAARSASSSTFTGVTTASQSLLGLLPDAVKPTATRILTLFSDRSTDSTRPTVCITEEPSVTATERSTSQADAVKSRPRTGDFECSICLDTMKDPTRLPCSHMFCRTCVNHPEVKRRALCPECRVPFGIPQGDQPPGGSMSKKRSFISLPGYPNVGTITIKYYIPSGIQQDNHPNPGKAYTGTTRTAYLPDNEEGRDVLRMLTEAFNRGLIFTVGTSHTSGATDCVVWNDIHHKTFIDGGPTNYGYPDPHYLKRVKEELAAKGIR